MLDTHAPAHVGAYGVFVTIQRDGAVTQHDTLQDAIEDSLANGGSVGHADIEFVRVAACLTCNHRSQCEAPCETALRLT